MSQRDPDSIPDVLKDFLRSLRRFHLVLKEDATKQDAGVLLEGLSF